MDNPIPVICAQCRTAGEAGADPFAHLSELLAFAPVPRRAHANGWTPDHQRAFIAALAVTGSPNRAARAIGRYVFGADQLRRARGGAGFAEAWDMALDIAHERDVALLRQDLAGLAAVQDAQVAARRLIDPTALLDPDASATSSTGKPTAARPAPTFDRHGIEQFTDADRQDYEDALARVQARLTRARRLYLATIADDADKRAAWEILVGPVDWARAHDLESQEDEVAPGQEWHLRGPDMLVTIAAGLVPDLVGGPDNLTPILDATRRTAAAVSGQGLDGLTEEEAAAVTAYRAALLAEGWTEDADGGLLSPLDEPARPAPPPPADQTVPPDQPVPPDPVDSPSPHDPAE